MRVLQRIARLACLLLIAPPAFAVSAPTPNIPILTMSEMDAIRTQITRCWATPVNAPIVRIQIQLQPDGSLQLAKLTPDELSRYAMDPFFRVGADSALRAVHMCTPLTGLPVAKYAAWHDIVLTFDPTTLAVPPKPPANTPSAISI